MADPCTSDTSKSMADDDIEPSNDSNSVIVTLSQTSSMSTSISYETSTSTTMSSPSEPVSLLSRLKSPSPSDLCR